MSRPNYVVSTQENSLNETSLSSASKTYVYTDGKENNYDYPFAPLNGLETGISKIIHLCVLIRLNNVIVSMYPRTQD